MARPIILADPLPDRSPALQLQEVTTPHPAEQPGESAQLDRYDIAVVLKASYEWGGYRYTNASDAIAAAKRAPGPGSAQ